MNLLTSATNIFRKLNELNMSTQGEKKITLQMSDQISAFKREIAFLEERLYHISFWLMSENSTDQCFLTNKEMSVTPARALSDTQYRFVEIPNEQLHNLFVFRNASTDLPSELIALEEFWFLCMH